MWAEDVCTIIGSIKSKGWNTLLRTHVDSNPYVTYGEI